MVSVMRFGLFVPQGWKIDLAGIETTEHWPTITRIARLAEDRGFESVWVFDHFHTVPAPTQEVTYEAWTLMASVAAVTDRVRLGQMCTCMGYRSPAYLAKVAASVDVISGGRLEMGVGAGWYEHEFEAYGYGFPRAGLRLQGLAEGVEIMKRMWTEDEATYAGDIFSVNGAICQPKPLQQPHVPLWIAGGGERKTLRIAAQHAQYTNFGGSPEVFERKSAILAEHCRELGTDFDAITRSSDFEVVIGETESEVADRLAQLEQHYRKYVPADAAARQMRNIRSGFLIGTPEQIVERLQEMQAFGMPYAITYFYEAAYDTSGIELFASKVMPELRG